MGHLQGTHLLCNILVFVFFPFFTYFEQEFYACKVESILEVNDKCYLCFHTWQTGQIKLFWVQGEGLPHNPNSTRWPVAGTLLSQQQPVFYEDRFILRIAQFVSCMEAFHPLILLNHSNVFAMWVWSICILQLSFVLSCISCIVSILAARKASNHDDIKYHDVLLDSAASCRLVCVKV